MARSKQAPIVRQQIQDVDFERALDLFRREANEATQYLYAYLAVHNTAGDHKAVHRLLNTTSLFWNTNLGALQSALFITLYRIFEPKSKHNVHQLLNRAHTNQHLFSKQALRRRKQLASANASEWLGDYLCDVHVPTPADFKALKTQVAKWRGVYERNYRPLRQKYFAHREVTESEEVTKLFDKTKIGELQEMLAFLRGLHDALLYLFLNGSQPVVKPSTGLERRITSEAERFLMVAAGMAKPPKKERVAR